MALTLYLHPLSSFCHKVLIALYESETQFEKEFVNLADQAASKQFFQIWPIGKIPVLHDASRDQTIAETTIIIEYLEQNYPGTRPLLLADGAGSLDVRFWDRFYDLYVHVPMQKIVGDCLRTEAERDPRGVAEARATLAKAYGMIDRKMADQIWAVGDRFTLADCAAAPALFYANIVEPFSEKFPNVTAYFERLLSRPSFKRAIAEAQPYFQYFPYGNGVPERFLT